MSKKIVYFDKDKIEEFKQRILVHGVDNAIKDIATEIDTDQSIEDRAEKKYHDAIVTINLAKKLRYIEGATEQSLIEQMKAKEFAEWCSINDFNYYEHSKKWAHISFPNAISKHCNVWYTTEELFNQFANK